MRILYPQEILSFYMFVVAIIGLTVNMISILLLRGSKGSNINVKGVVSHMLADAVSSIGIVVVAIIIYYTDYISIFIKKDPNRPLYLEAPEYLT